MGNGVSCACSAPDLLASERQAKRCPVPYLVMCQPLLLSSPLDWKWKRGMEEELQWRVVDQSRASFWPTTFLASRLSISLTPLSQIREWEETVVQWRQMGGWKWLPPANLLPEAAISACLTDGPVLRKQVLQMHVPFPVRHLRCAQPFAQILKTANLAV